MDKSYFFKVKDMYDVDLPRIFRENPGVNSLLITESRDDKEGCLFLADGFTRKFTNKDGLSVAGRSLNSDWGISTVFFTNPAHIRPDKIVDLSKAKYHGLIIKLANMTNTVQELRQANALLANKQPKVKGVDKEGKVKVSVHTLDIELKDRKGSVKKD
jgi:hypothetical protein